jgi:threonine/homoserine/homoserine lactone efflux protein
LLVRIQLLTGVPGSAKTIPVTKGSLFMSDIAFWSAFLLTAILINISPGPELVFVISRTITHGKKHGFYSSLGTGSGSMIHVVMVAFGLAFILSKSLVAFNIIKIMGAAYLFYLGIKAFLSKGTEALVENKNADNQETSLASYQKGFWVGVLNPKSVMFFMSFLPQFVRADSGTFGQQIIILGTITNSMAIVFEAVAILMTSQVSKMLFRNRSFSSLIDKVSGSILILLGLRLVLTPQNK